MKTSAFLGAVALCAGQALSAVTWTVGQTVVSSSGTINGHAAAVSSNVSEYLGIPYAIPPIGDLRWTAPQAYRSTQTINGSSVGFSCPAGTAGSSGTTPNTAGANLTAAGVLILAALGQVGERFGEDCLTVNVWTKPQVGETRKAVLVWIHGGSYTSGSGGGQQYNGQYIADQEDVVVVTLNYRLNILGFPGNPGATQNLGMLDQRLAIEWVRDNIANFGGDPSRITLFGQSAGSSSIDHYTYAWTRDPIANAFILESGTVTFLPPNTVPGLGQATANASASSFARVAATAGCTGDAATTLACMKRLPYTTVISALRNTTGAAFGPTIDNTIVFSDYLARSAAGNFIKRPLLIGNTNYEAGLFKLLGVLNGNPQPEAYWNAFNSLIFDCPAAARANVSVSNRVPTWRYRWFGVFPNTNLTTSPDSGAWHGSEIPILFDTAPSPALYPGVPNNTPAELLVGSYLRGAWAAFAKNPVNGLSSYGGSTNSAAWPGYSPNNQSLARLGYESLSGANLAAGNAYDQLCGATFPINTTSSTNTSSSTPARQSSSGAGQVYVSGLLGCVGALAAWCLL